MNRNTILGTISIGLFAIAIVITFLRTNFRSALGSAPRERIFNRISQS